MKRSSIIRGLAAWAGKEIKPRLPQFSVQRLSIAAFEKMAETAPDVAEAMAISFAPHLQTLLAASDQGKFDAVADVLVAAVEAEEKILISLPGPMGPIPYSLTKTDFQHLVDAIRTAEASA